jgi:glycosyltransferase involved in cell wall biosynthesis
VRVLYLSGVRIPSEKASGLAIVRQCQAFVDIGHTVELIIPSRSNRKNQSIESEYGIIPRFHIENIKSKGIYSLGKFGFGLMLLYEGLQMFRYFFSIRKQVDVIYSRDQRLLVLFILFGFRDRCYVELHTKHLDPVTHWVIKKVKKVIVISHGLKDLYEEATNRDNIHIEPSGVDLQQFENLPPVEMLRDEFSLPQNKIIFGYIGKYKTMGESKGVEEIIEAFALAHKEDNRIFLFLVGIEERETEEVLEICKKVDLPAAAFTLSPLLQSKFARYLMVCDVLMMNYPNTEHYARYMSPTKLFAYLATGKPIISSDLPAIRAVVKQDLLLFVSPGSISAYTDEILYSADHIEALSKAGNVRKQFAFEYTWERRARRLFDQTEI